MAATTEEMARLAEIRVADELAETLGAFSYEDVCERLADEVDALCNPRVRSRETLEFISARFAA